MEIFNFLSKRQIGLPLTIFLLLISFAGSIVYEYYINMVPSYLCIAQRYCTISCIFFLVISLVPIESIHRRCIDFSCIFLFWGIGISGYHLLLQYKILREPSFLRHKIPLNISIEKLNEISNHNALISSTNINPTIFEIPTTAGTFVLFVFLFIYLSYCFKKVE